MQAPKGFTIIELLVVVAITAMLSAVAITYSSISRDEIALTIEESKIAQAILQAKALSIATFKTGAAAACGYGVAINMTVPQSYSIFAFSPGGTPCPTVASTTQIGIIPQNDEKQYTSGTWQVPIVQGVSIQSQSDSMAMVLFSPPDPVVLLSADGSSFPNPVATLKIHLITVDQQNTATISINPEGQVSF